MSNNTNTPVSFVGKHTFTSDEKESKLQQMLTAMREKEEIEAELKTAKSNYKSKIDSKDGEIKLMSNLLNAGFENRTYNCLLTKNFDEGRREYREIGTDILVGTEALTAADYQTQMDLTEANIKANNEAADKLEDVIADKIEEAGLHIVSFDEDMTEHLPVEPEVIKEPTTKKGGDKKETIKIELVPEEPLDDIFGIDDNEDEEEIDPFSFNDI